ncbi:MAG TPA: amino acid adenylation domain-containing protein, partial [Herpetosiphonaceae bacterium]
MTVAEFLLYLRTHDVRLRVEGGQLRVNAPKGVLTPELRQSIADRKAEVIAFLIEAKDATSADATTIKPIPRTGPLPLSFSQQRLWVLHQFNPQDASYHLPFALHIKGDFHQALLQRCLDEIVRRHESLRTAFAATDDTITQIIAPPQPVALTLINLESQPAAEQAATVRAIITEEAQRPFDLSQGPLLRVSLLRLGAQEHVVSLTIHHIISDAWSLGIFARELTTLYEAFSAEKPSPLPELPIQYADFAAWQRQWLSGEVFERQLAYWKNQLAGAPAKLALPTDRPRPPVQSFRGARYLQLLPQQLSAALNELGHQEEATLFMVLLASFQALLVRYTGQDDMVIGTAMAGRELAELNEVIGYFANTLPLRTDLTGNPTFRQALRRVQQTCLEAYAHQDVPFERLVKELADERDLSYAPIFQVLLVLQNAATDTIQLPGLTLSYLESHGGAARFDLSLDVAETPEGLHCAYEYNTDLFDAATIERLAEHFQSLLHDITAQPDRRLFDLALLTEDDLQQLSVWNASYAEYPRAECIHQLFEAQAERTPESIAVVFGDQQLSYAALNARANRLAHRLQALGVSADVMVGLCVERSLDLIVGVLGILKAGGAYVPLDPNYPAGRLQFMLADAQVPVVVTQSHLVEQFPPGSAGEAQIAPAVICLDRDSEILSSAQLPNPQIQTTPENLAYVIYTSGSTGRPKGVQIPHQAVVNFLHAMQRQPGLSAHDRLLAVTTLSFDIAALEIFLPLVSGAEVVLASREVAADGVQLANLLNREAITVMQATPATWRMLLHAGWQGQPGLKILCGGEALPRLLADQLLSSGASLWNMYGPTETTIWSSVAQIAVAAGDMPIGGPIANTQLYVLDRQMQRVPVGVAGELYIGGEGLARGYLNRPELTAERFVPDPFARVSGARLYRVGDLMRYRADGTLEFLGRVDHQVKVRGYRIEIGEIESALNQHLAIREAVVMARQDTSNETRLVAYVVEEPRTKNQEPNEEQRIENKGTKEQANKDGENAAPPSPIAMGEGDRGDEGLTTDSLRRFLHDKLPEYMIPTAFVFLDALPLTPNGKVDRKALPAPDTSRPELEAAFVAPQTAAEQALADIWKQVLGLHQIGIHDNF